MKFSSPTKAKLRRIAHRYARTSGKEWVEEVSELYRREAERRRAR